MQRPTSSRLAGAVAVATAAVLALTGCATPDDGGPAAADPTPAVTEPAAEPTPDQTPQEPAEEPTEAPVEEPADAPDEPTDSTIIPAGSTELAMLDATGDRGHVISDLRVEAHEGFDRVILDLTATEGAAGLPGWFARFGDAAMDLDDTVIEVDGQYVLSLNVLLRAPLPEKGDGSIPEHTTVDFDGAAVVSVVNGYWHAGERMIFIGIDGATQPEVTITRVADSPRIEIDVAHIS